MKYLKIPCFAFYILTVAVHAQSQEARPVDQVKEINFDGHPFEEQWNKTIPLPMTVFSPVYKGDPTERTEFRLGYDEKYLYVSGRFYDSDPNGIQGNTLIRDRNAAGDFMNVMIDSFNDNETFWYFGTMPSGVRIDAEIAQDAEGSNIFNGDWNTFWDVKTVETDSGWFAEMRIPFSSLRFKSDNEEVIFGFSVNRLIGRKFERHTYPDIPPNWPAAVWKASQASKLKITGIKASKPLYVTPYLLAGFSKANELSPASSAEDWKTEVGGDVKIGLSSSYTLDLTANTDFAQVEADNFQSNLTRFSLFFPEKRQFFQERGGIFNFQLSGLNRLFHSRVIGLTEDGRPQRVYGGARLVGRTKGFDLGVMDMHTEAVDSVGSLNFGVIRVRQRVFNLNSYVGGILTTRLDENNRYNITYGIDGLIRTHKQNFLTVKGGQSVYDDSDSDNYFAYAKWEKRAFKGFGYSLELDKTADGFNPGVGFILRKNLLLGQTVSYGFFLQANNMFRSITPSVANSIYLRNSDQSLETQVTEASTDFAFLSGAAVGLSYRRTYDEVDVAFSFNEEATVNAGDYEFHSAGLSYRTNSDNRFVVRTSAEFGSYYDGRRTILNVSPTWALSKHLELSGGYTYDFLKFDDRDESTRADIGFLNALIAFNLHWSVSSLIQYNELTDKFGINARLRYNRREGNDLFIVFNHLTDVEGNIEGENKPFVENWSILVKYTHALNLTK